MNLLQYCYTIKQASEKVKTLLRIICGYLNIDLNLKTFQKILLNLQQIIL